MLPVKILYGSHSWLKHWWRKIESKYLSNAQAIKECSGDFHTKHVPLCTTVTRSWIFCLDVFSVGLNCPLSVPWRIQLSFKGFCYQQAPLKPSSLFFLSSLKLASHQTHTQGCTSMWLQVKRVCSLHSWQVKASEARTLASGNKTVKMPLSTSCCMGGTRPMVSFSC